MARPKKTEETKVKVTEKTKGLTCFPIYKGEFGKVAPERKGK